MTTPRGIVLPPATACPNCNGTGQIRHHSKDQIGGLAEVTTEWTTLCECRASLPSRHGKVSWWTYGKPRTVDMTTADGLTDVSLTWTPELPVSADNYPLHRTLDNAHFVGTISIEVDNGPALTSDGLREIAAFLVRVADDIEKWDEPVADEPATPGARA